MHMLPRQRRNSFGEAGLAMSRSAYVPAYLSLIFFVPHIVTLLQWRSVIPQEEIHSASGCRQTRKSDAAYSSGAAAQKYQQENGPVTHNLSTPIVVIHCFRG